MEQNKTASKIVFMGTPDFAVPSLRKLIDNFDVCAVVTQPDKQRGRGKKITFSPVKEVALENNIKVLQPEKLKNDLQCFKTIQDLKPDFIVVVAFGQILTKEVLNLPKYACINVHASLLPKYRGAAPINWCIINGEKHTGVTTMLMAEGLDTGDMLMKSEVTITDEMNYGELHNILSTLGSELIVQTIIEYKNGNLKGIKQLDSESSYASKINKEMGHINWGEDEGKIINLIRGLNPYPATFTDYNGQNMKIYKAKFICNMEHTIPGEIINIDKNGIIVSTSKGCIAISEISFPGGKRMTVEQYIRGNKIEKGLILK